jgi:hypothetical protein
MSAPEPRTSDAYTIDPKLADFASDRQKEYIAAVNRHGSFKGAARALGVSHDRVRVSLRTLEKLAASKGYAPGHFSDGVAPGYLMRKVTVQRGPGGEVERTWERQSPDDTNREDMLREFVRHLAEDVRGLAPLTPAPEHCLDDLLAVYIFGDPHFGLRALAAETGDDFGIDDADRLTRAGIDRLVSSAPRATKGLLINVGDATHADNSKNVTPGHGHALDVDGRHFNTVQVTARAWVYAIKRMLTHHAEVEVWMLPGNHDPETSFAVALCLSMYFEGEPRVKVDLSPSLFRRLKFGKNLIGAHHGHGVKPQEMPLLMATDYPQEWGETEFRVIFMGHLHHDWVKEVMGVRMETVRSLAGKDAWHHGKGYRSMRDTRVVIHHKDFGEVERHTCSVAMLERAA